MKRNITIFILAFLVFFNGFAQRKAVSNKRFRKGNSTKEKIATSNKQTSNKSDKNLLPKELLASTAKLMFIDSMVVSKEEFYKYIPTDKELGAIIYSDSDVPVAPIGGIGFLNGMNDQYLFTQGDSLSLSIYASNKLDKEWSQPKRIEEISKLSRFAINPYQLFDGATLFFAAKTPQTLGEYDIFMTRYKREDGSYFAPENYGLPFNSTANDYLLAIDEVNSLGWLVTDRRQPEGQVCIYTFVPTHVRKTFEGDNLTDSELYNFATINKISDTWKFGDREAAMKRLENLKARQGKLLQTTSVKNIFTINDNLQYRSISDFRSAKSRKLFEDYQEAINKKNKLSEKLQVLRNSYKLATVNARIRMTNEIWQIEKEYITLTEYINKIHKSVLIEENNLINN